MNVLVLNAGSSSVKYQLLHVETKEVLTKGACERYLLTTMLFSFNETGYAQYGSAVTLLIILIIILINFVTNKLTGASFDKGIGG